MFMFINLTSSGLSRLMCNVMCRGDYRWDLDW
jgi:hypothetical protein